MFLCHMVPNAFLHMSVGAEQAREVVTLVTSEAPFSYTVGRDVVS